MRILFWKRKKDETTEVSSLESIIFALSSIANRLEALLDKKGTNIHEIKDRAEIDKRIENNLGKKPPYIHTMTNPSDPNDRWLRNSFIRETDKGIGWAGPSPLRPESRDGVLNTPAEAAGFLEERMREQIRKERRELREVIDSLRTRLLKSDGELARYQGYSRQFQAVNESLKKDLEFVRAELAKSVSSEAKYSKLQSKWAKATRSWAEMLLAERRKRDGAIKMRDKAIRDREKALGQLTGRP